MTHRIQSVRLQIRELLRRCSVVACFRTPLIHILIVIIACNIGNAQHITLNNPSMEGNVGRDSLPFGWAAAANTPDVLPGIFGIWKRPTDGKTYVGLHSGPGYKEGVEQKLPAVLVGGLAYTMSFDLAYTPQYIFGTCYGNLTIYGGNAPGDTAERLWTSGTFRDTSWKRYTAILLPSENYKYISFWADPTEDCDKSAYGVGLVMDNLSSIRQTLNTVISASASCNNTPTGAVAVKVNKGQGPYTYNWTPGNYKTDHVGNLPPGTYTVNVRAADGLTGGGTAIVEKSDLQAKVTITTSDCSGDNNNQIKVDVTGGVPPYRYYLNEQHPASTPLFEKLEPGNYRMIIRDDVACADTFGMAIREPAPLVVKDAHVTPCSCTEVSDGKLALQIAGGTWPYEYRLLNTTWQSDSILTNLKTGNSEYEIRDANGCLLNSSSMIPSPYPNCVIIMPNAFSPNRDGNNDVFRPKVYDAITNYSLRVYNRWGGLVFQSNDPRYGWDGTCKGVLQPAQTFIYVCTFHDHSNTPREYRGSLMLVQ